MILVRRLAALLMSVLLLQVALAEHALACVGHAATMAGRAMPAMPEHGVHGVPGGRSPSVEAPAANSASVPMHRGCGMPGTPACASMSSCAPSALTVGAPVLLVPTAEQPMAQPRVRYLAPSSPTSAPELPPPRA